LRGRLRGPRPKSNLPVKTHDPLLDLSVRADRPVQPELHHREIAQARIVTLPKHRLCHSSFGNHFRSIGCCRSVVGARSIVIEPSVAGQLSAIPSALDSEVPSAAILHRASRSASPLTPRSRAENSAAAVAAVRAHAVARWVKSSASSPGSRTL
jgi:hypothetical protein